MPQNGAPNRMIKRATLPHPKQPLPLTSQRPLPRYPQVCPGQKSLMSLAGTTTDSRFNKHVLSLSSLDPALMITTSSKRKLGDNLQSRNLHSRLLQPSCSGMPDRAFRSSPPRRRQIQGYIHVGPNSQVPLPRVGNNNVSHPPASRS